MSDTYDLIVRDAVIVDGSNAPRFRGDVALRGERIAAVGRLDRKAHAAREIDAAGRVAAPGFIDAHTHDDRLLLSSPEMTPKLSQGVTTVISGNCGVSLAPLEHRGGAVPPPLDLLDDAGEWYRFRSFAEYCEALSVQPPAINFAPLVGHSTLRVATMDGLERAASAAEIARMRTLVREALDAGALGVSSGTYYEPARAAPTAELIEVCRPLAERDALYVTHMRDEAERVVESLDETFAIGRALGVGVVISHHKVAGRPNHGRSKETLAHIARHMREQEVGLDCYPYCASSTILSADRAAVSTRTLVSWSKPHPELAGMDLAAIAARLGVPEDEAVARLVPAGGIYFAMDENDVQRILAFERTMIGSDGLPHDAAPHPRLWGTFPRVLGHYCRELGLFPLETAVHKMTGLSARCFGLADRGVIREGAYADITLFDPERVAARASFEQPLRAAAGIDTVIVNGAVAWENGRATAARSGRQLRREPPAKAA